MVRRVREAAGRTSARGALGRMPSRARVGILHYEVFEKVFFPVLGTVH